MKFYIPDSDFAEYYASRSPSKWATSDPDGKFTGTLLYTTLTGAPISAAKYFNGIITRFASICDGAGTAANTKKLADLLIGIYLGRTNKQISTRGIFDNNFIDAVVIVADAVRVPSKNDNLPEPIPSVGGGGGGGDGAGNGLGSNSSNGLGASSSYASKPNFVFFAPKVESLLDLLFADCAGGAIVMSLDMPVEITVGSFRGTTAGFKYLLRSDGSVLLRTAQIELGSKVDAIVLFEELLHILQMTKPDFERSINKEIEAKLGWILFNERRGGDDNFDNKLGPNGGTEKFKLLIEFIKRGDTSSAQFFSAYDEAVQCLRSIGVYSDEEKYPDIPAARNANVLQEVMANCN